MANTVSRLTIAPQEAGVTPVSPPNYIAARVLAANTAKTITVPAGAAFVRLTGTADFWISYTVTGGSLVAAVVPVDADDGTSNEQIKVNGSDVWRLLPAAITALSVISNAGGGAIVTASFYGQ